jgi:CubicO group peptidase (beta-lactamase class C family)
MTVSHFLQCASLSKTVAAAFAIDFFNARNISLNTPVNSLLQDIGSPWRLELPTGQQDELKQQWPSMVTLTMLMNHTALGMPYVFGVPNGTRMLRPLELLTGAPEARALGYPARLVVEREPGRSFAYSGGGFIVLQHILETMLKIGDCGEGDAGRGIDDAMRTFMDG